MTDPFYAYTTYIALKSHFTTSYDFIKYRGKIRASRVAFENVRGKYFYEKLARKYEPEQLIEHLVANMLGDTIPWIGDIAGEEGTDNYLAWKKRKHRRSYSFDNDIQTIFDYAESNTISVDECIAVQPGYHPPLLHMLLNRKIELESFIILSDCINFKPRWDDGLNDIIWETQSAKIANYRPFVLYDKPLYMQKLRKKYSQNN